MSPQDREEGQKSHVFAICANSTCGAAFEFDTGIRAGAKSTIRFVDSWAGPCPHCKGMGKILNGTYRYKDQLLQLVDGPVESLETYRQLMGLLKLFRKAPPTKEEALESIEKISPQAAKSFQDLITKENAGNWIAILIAFVGLMIQFYSEFKPDDKVSDGKDQFIEYLTNENKDLKAQLKAEREQDKKFLGIPPKAKCPCGSGKRFKKCHGQPRT